MRYVILRDDDTNALTPPAWLERLYRPFLERGMPVNLATIPRVWTEATQADGTEEGFLLGTGSPRSRILPLAENAALCLYLRETPGYHVVQHGCTHSPNEFDSTDERELDYRLADGARALEEAGFERPTTFVAPYDKLSAAGFVAAARRFTVVSTGWFELRRLPPVWWPRYVWKKLRHRPHWRIGNTLLLSHCGCLLSYRRPRQSMLAAVKAAVQRQSLTVLVTHWWEYFPGGRPDQEFIQILHEVAEWIAHEPDIEMVSFDQLVRGDARRTPFRPSAYALQS